MARKKESWWKTFDYRSGHTYILGEKFSEKSQAMAYAKTFDMAILPQSTVSITDEEYKNAILENENKELKKRICELVGNHNG